MYIKAMDEQLGRIAVSAEMHRSIKVQAAKERRMMKDIVEQLIREYLAKKAATETSEKVSTEGQNSHV